MRRIIVSLLFSAVTLFFHPEAVTLTVTSNGDTQPTGFGDAGELRNVLNTINQSPAGTYTVDFNLGTNNTIILGGMLPILNLNHANTLTIDGNNDGTNLIHLSGNSTFPGLFARQGTISIANMNIVNTNATGGNGASGGLGAGGGLFIDSAAVTLSKVQFVSNKAIGGGGLVIISNLGGGGTFGNTTTTGGGGGIASEGRFGGGGIGSTALGGVNNAAGANGLGFGAAAAGAGGGGSGGLNAGGGGGSDAGITLGGGGGGISGASFSGINGGDGGYGGGGGLGSITAGSRGGNGGFGGGGGGVFAANTTGGNGGFGGGGGVGIVGGDGGFGASIGSATTLGTPGVGGGLNANGGGAALGAAIFVNSGQNSSYFNPTSTNPVSGGGSLKITGPMTIAATSLTPGTGPGGNGASAGGAIFATTSTNTTTLPFPITLEPATGQTITIGGPGGAIADDSAHSLPGGTYRAGTATGVPLLMQGAGTLVLLNNSTFSGGVVLANGVTVVASNQALGNPASPVEFQGNATLQAGAGIFLLYPFHIFTGINATIDTNGNLMNIGGVISGTGALTKIGTGSLDLQNVNTYSGGTTINNGELFLVASGSLLSTGSVTVNSPGFFSINSISGSSSTIGDLSGNGGVILNNKTLVAGTSNSTTFSGIIQGSTGGNLTKQGTGTLTLSGPNTYNGITTISAGTLQITTSSIVTNVVDNATLAFNQTTDGSFGKNISGTGAVIVGGGTAVQPIQIEFTGTNSYTGGTTVQANTALYGPVISIQGNINNSGIVDFEQPASTTGIFNGVISGAGITSINNIPGTNTGKVVFTAGQLYTLDTVIANGILALSGVGALQASAPVQIGSTATFDISGITPTGTTIGDLTGGGFVKLGSKFLTFGTATASTTYSGVIQGSGGIVKQGTGVAILSGANTFTGTTTISAGTLQIGTGNIVGNIINNATLDINQNTTGTYAGAISGTGTVFINEVGGTGRVILSGNNTYTGNTGVVAGLLELLHNSNYSFSGAFIVNTGATIDFEQTANTGTYSGGISGAGNVAVNQFGGTGTVVLSGISNTGTTTVFNGTLELFNNTNVTIPTSITVNAGATLDLEQAAGTTGIYTGNINGAGNLAANKNTGTGTVILTSGSHAYTGSTTVYNGILQIFNAVDTTTLGQLIVMSPGTLGLEQATGTSGIYSGGITGAGTLNINDFGGGTGTIIFSGSSSSFTGTTTVFAGTLQGSPASLPAGTVKLNTSGFLDIEQVAGIGTYTGSIQDNGVGQHGSVDINKQGGVGTVILTGVSSYSGGTIVHSGILEGAASILQGDIKIKSDALVNFEQPTATLGTYAGNISDFGAGHHGAVSINRQGGTGTVVFSGTNTYSGGTTVLGGTWQGPPGSLQGDINVVSNAIVDFEQTTGTATYSGVISGAGSVLVNSLGTSLGTVIFSGANTYSGGTLVSGGTLQGDTKSLQKTITDNATLTFSQNFDGVFKGNLLGTGTVNVTGTGRVAFNTNSNAFSGTTNIQQGHLILNSILGGNLFIQNGGRLSGTGTVLGNLTVQNGGVIAPGNSIGTLNVGGNYVQQAGSFYEVQVNGIGQSSLINVTGQATLNNGSGLNVVPLDGQIAANTLYTILTAAGGVNGTYSLVTIDNPLITPQVLYDSNHAFLLLTVNFNPIAQTFNQKQVAQQLATLDTNASPALKAVLSQLAQLPPEQASHALSQMSAEQYTNLIMTTELANRQFLRRMFDPIRSIVTSNPCKKSPSCTALRQPFDTWLAISGGRSFIRGNKNAHGFRVADYEISGGLQTTYKCWTLGSAVSYERDNIEYKVGGSGRCNTVLGGIYGLFRPKKFYVFADLAAGYSCDHMRRTINDGNLHLHPRGSAKIYQTTFYAEAGKDYGFNFILLQPFLGFEFGHYRFNKFSEHGGNPLDMTVYRKAHNNAYSRLGVHMTSAPLSNGFSMGVDVAWRYRLTSLSNTVDLQFQDFGSKFKIKGLPLNRNSYEGIVRFNQKIGSRWEVFLETTLEGWEGSTIYSFIAGVKATW